MRTTKTIKITGKSRREIRKELIDHFLDEEPGEGRGELCSHYIYYVEVLADKRRVFLKRPAPLNKGFDFEVHVEGLNFGESRRTTMPSHAAILRDLSLKKSENPQDFLRVKELIADIYNCNELKDIEYIKTNFREGYPIEAILKAIKWLFIEQDMTYWNWSGRNMFYSALNQL